MVDFRDRIKTLIITYVYKIIFSLVFGLIICKSLYSQAKLTKTINYSIENEEEVLGYAFTYSYDGDYLIEQIGSYEGVFDWKINKTFEDGKLLVDSVYDFNQSSSIWELDWAETYFYSDNAIYPDSIFRDVMSTSYRDIAQSFNNGDYGHNWEKYYRNFNGTFNEFDSVSYKYEEGLLTEEITYKPTGEKVRTDSYTYTVDEVLESVTFSDHALKNHYKTIYTLDNVGNVMLEMEYFAKDSSLPLNEWEIKGKTEYQYDMSKLMGEIIYDYIADPFFDLFINAPIEENEYSYKDDGSYKHISRRVYEYEGELGSKDNYLEVLESRKQVYPNPTSSIVNLWGGASYEVRDMFGELVLEGTGNYIDLSTVESGSYLISQEGHTQIVIKR